MEEKRILPVKQIISGIKSGRTDDDEIMLKYNLTTKDLQILFDKLLVAGLVTKNELEQRSFSFADTFELDLENDNPVNDGRSLSESTSDAHREDDHVDNSWECPACGKIQATRFDECPKCGVIVHKYLEKQAKERKKTESISSELLTPQTEQGTTVLDSTEVERNEPKTPSDKLFSRTLIRLRDWIVDVNSLYGRTRFGKITKVVMACVGLLLLIGFLGTLAEQGKSVSPERTGKIPQNQTRLAETPQEPKKSAGFSNPNQISDDVTSLKSSAEKGDAESQYRLGRKYYNGEGVQKDFEETAKWMKKAAEQGHSGAQSVLGGLLYYLGHGVPKDLSQARKWVEKSAKQGNAPAQYVLGMFYFHGEGGPTNLVEAEKWLKKSAEQGYIKAEQGLEILRSQTSETSQESKQSIVPSVPDKSRSYTTSEKLANTRNMLMAAFDGDLATVKILLDKGVNVNDKDEDSGGTALIKAAVMGHLEVVKFLIDKGADVNTPSKIGRTPLMCASPRLEVVKFLLDKGAKVNAKDEDGFTTLMFASMHNAPGVAKLVLDRGADVNARDIHGRTALSLLLMDNHPDRDMLRLLRSYGAKQ